MKCPVCDDDGKKRVLETRTYDTVVLRTRICLGCGYVFTTEETYDHDAQQSINPSAG